MTTSKALLTQPLRDEHQDLRPHIERLRVAAESVGTAQFTDLRQEVDDAYTFLTGHLIPHAHAEERALYPVVGRVLGAPAATATMSRDHVEIGQLTEELGALRATFHTGALAERDSEALRRVLYGLYALVKVHFAKEEEVYLPLLDARLQPEEAQAMFQAMTAAASETLGHHAH
jgi:iron-sulfur cluster repair protein YtfE (RIC family)